MKRISILALHLFLFATVFAQTKTKLTEGVAEYTISYPGMTKEMKQMEAMLPKSLLMYFKGDKGRGEMSMGSGKTVYIADGKKKEVVVLMDMMGKKIAIRQNDADMKKKQAEMEKAGALKDVKVTYTKETKVIAGYTCKKATVAFTVDGKQEKMDCYYTEDLPYIYGANEHPAFSQIKGFLMGYKIKQQGIEMNILAKSVKAQTVADNLFTIPKDYKVMTAEEMQKMMTGGE